MAIYIQIMSKRTHFFKSLGRGPPPFPLSSEKVPQRELHGSSSSARSGAGSRPTQGATKDPSRQCYGQKICTTTQGPGENTHWYSSGWIRPQSGQSCKAGIQAAECHQLMSSSCQQTGHGVQCTHTSTSLWSLQAEVEEETLFQPFFWPVMKAIQVCKGHFPMQLWCCFLQGTIIKVRFSFQHVLSTSVFKASGSQTAGKESLWSPELFYLLSCALLGACIMPVWRWEPHLSCLLGCCNLLCPELIISDSLEAAASC